ncbi:hypothetical protein V496_10058 [Pseudogymnoascus sp. VKM F-4515 (FW-2607)]|nr:hypothetical protein V496_10058 [Pseudogymnoascus sp. VKM F-4515 (FW-2607)]KFY99186.1 hypothetical protein V498_00952 [Pseudogymnoascus sp. VKM F-4517 (FW-2822)]
MHDFCKPSKTGIEFWEDGMPLMHYEDYTETWQPLANFVGQLAGLQDLVWAYDDPLPRCILSAVDVMSCRLHMHSFCLSSLIQHRNHRCNVDPDEFALATSSSLYSIVVPFHDWDSDGNLDYNREAALPAGVVTDFAKLHHLTIHWNTDSSGVVTSLQTLRELAIGSGFKSLNTLVLSIPRTNARPMQDALVQLLEHLNPLDILDLTGFIGNETLEPALIRHGGTLRKLRVIPYRGYGTRRPMIEFSEAVILRLVELCPNLEQVEIPINRTHSDARETGIYRALGGLSRLNDVSLKLEFTVGTIKQDEEEGEEELQDDEEEEELIFRISAGDDLPLADIQDDFNNGAIDSSLALSIFNLISSGGSLRQLRLQIRRTRGPGSDNGDLNYMLAWIGRNWTASRTTEAKSLSGNLARRRGS